MSVQFTLQPVTVVRQLFIMTDWLTDWLIDWLTDWLDSSTVWKTGWTKWRQVRADKPVSETDTWDQLKDSKRIGSKILKTLDAYCINFESSFLHVQQVQYRVIPRNSNVPQQLKCLLGTVHYIPTPTVDLKKMFKCPLCRTKFVVGTKNITLAQSREREQAWWDGRDCCWAVRSVGWVGAAGTGTGRWPVDR